jgi:hypothetical protein
VPAGWQILGFEKQEITLPPLDSTLIPIRVAVGENVRGDIGYSIIAAITDSRGNLIKNEYSFVKIPREVDLKVKFLTRFEYLDQQTGYAPVKVKNRNGVMGKSWYALTLRLTAISIGNGTIKK